MKRSISIVLPLLLIAVLTACVSPTRMLERAGESWVGGRYVEAVNLALDSYERAVELNRNPDEINAARAFLKVRFPEANANLAQLAERQLSGFDAEKTEAWRIYDSLVSMNRRVKDSMASSFLTAVDYTEELAEAKETASQLMYVQALEFLDQDVRESYIHAVAVFDKIDSIIPGYRDIRTRRKAAVEAGTVVVAFSNRNFDVEVKQGNIASLKGIEDGVYDAIRNYIVSKDHSEFVNFILVETPLAAENAGAALMVEIIGEVWVSAERDEVSKGRIIWKRSYGGDPLLIVTRISDQYRITASAHLRLDQSVEIEFFPIKYSTQTLTSDLYQGQFNNAAWMASQLAAAKSVMTSDDGDAEMVVWAEMQYGGIVDFLKTAQVIGTEGIQTLPMDPAAYQDTAGFINNTLAQFLTCTDIDLDKRLVKELTQAYLSDKGMTSLLSNL